MVLEFSPESIFKFFYPHTRLRIHRSQPPFLSNKSRNIPVTISYTFLRAKSRHKYIRESNPKVIFLMITILDDRRINVFFKLFIILKFQIRDIRHPTFQALLSLVRLMPAPNNVPVLITKLSDKDVSLQHRKCLVLSVPEAISEGWSPVQVIDRSSFINS